MNDFTKEELQDIIRCVGQFKVASLRGGSDYYNTLCDKIQSMIDNYCEHEGIYYEYSADGSGRIARCMHRFDNNRCIHCNTKFIEEIK